MATKAAKYQILVMSEPGTPALINPETLKKYIFTDPARAAQFAKDEARKTPGLKLCVKPLLDNLWRDRENRRFNDGVYDTVSWINEGWWQNNSAYAIHKDHFVHVSRERLGWVAYTRTPEDGMKDKQTLVRPGTYLKRYFAEIISYHGYDLNGIVNHFIAQHGPIDVKFATTEQEMVDVYECGPGSCMSYPERDSVRNSDGEDCEYATPDGMHPVRVYAAGDLQVAYLGEPDDYKSEGVSARALVWPAQKTYSRVYGDKVRLETGLKRLGYKWGAPIGARLQRFVNRKFAFDPQRGHNPPAECFVAPYIDKLNESGGGHLGVKDKGDHLVICHEGADGSHHCGGTGGLTGRYVPQDGDYPTYTCQRCLLSGLRSTNTVHVTANASESQLWCDECLGDHSTWCGYSQRSFSNDHDIEFVEVGGNLWTQHYADLYAARCDGSGELTDSRTMQTIETDDGPRRYSSVHIRRLGGSYQSSLTGKRLLKAQDPEMYIHTGSWGDRVICATSELRTHGFRCDGCDTPWTLDHRHQSHGDDRLYCGSCNYRIVYDRFTPVSTRRRLFEQERANRALANSPDTDTARDRALDNAAAEILF